MNFFLKSLKFETLEQSEKSIDPFDATKEEEETLEDDKTAEGQVSIKKQKRQIDVLPVDDLEAHLKKHKHSTMMSIIDNEAIVKESDTLSDKLVVRENK